MNHARKSFIFSALCTAVCALSLNAVAALSPSGDTTGAADYAAITQAVAGGGTVELDEGTFYVNAQITLSSAVTLKGAGRDLTTIRQTVTKAKTSGLIQRVVYMNHASALLRDVTISGGYAYAGGANVSNNGTAILIDTNGGSVLDCRVTDNYMGMNVYSAVYLNSANAFVGRTIIDNNKSLNTYDNKYGFPGTGAYVKNGRLESCLIFGNENEAYSRGGSMPAVAAEGGAVVNCTIVNNSGVNGSGAKASSNGRFYNCIIYGNVKKFTNGTYTGSADWDGTEANFISCLFTDPDFKDEENGDYHLKTSSAARENGNNTDIVISDSYDLGGVQKLVRNGLTDIGCYQYVDDGEKSCEIQLGALNTVIGRPVSLTAVVDGVNPADCDFTWTAGDKNASGVSTTISFSETGTYTVSLVVTEKSGVAEVFNLSAEDQITVYPMTVNVGLSDNLAAAIANQVDGQTFMLAPGEHVINNELTLSAGITVQGAGRDLTTVRMQSGQYKRVFHLNNADAVVKDMTIADGGCNSANNNVGSYHGGGVWIDTLGGTVENCRIIGCQTGMNGCGMAVYCQSSSGLISQCVITNNFSANKFPSGGAVTMTGGKIRYCLIADNVLSDGTSRNAYYPGGVSISNGARMYNCTVVNNHGRGLGGVSAAGTAECIFNSIIYGNTPATHYGDDLADFNGNASCCTASLVSPSESPIVNKETRDYHLCNGSAAIGQGTWYDWMNGSNDLEGMALESPADIGCYKFVQSESFNCIMKESAAITFPGKSVQFTAELDNGIDAGDYEFAWTFGPLASAVQNPVMTFYTLGTYDVKLVITKKDGGQKVFEETKNAWLSVHEQTVTLATTDDVLSAFSQLVDGQLVEFGEGVFEVTNEIVISAAVTVSGQGWNKTTLLRTGAAKSRVVRVCNAGAVLKKVSVIGGKFDTSVTGNGAGVLITAGTVVDCRIALNNGGMNGKGDGVSVEGKNAHLTCSYIEYNTNTVLGARGGGGVYVASGKVDNCLVRGNYIKEHNAQYDYASGSGILADGGEVENCTVIGNYGLAGGLAASGSAIVRNCISIGNTLWPRNERPTKENGVDRVYPESEFESLDWSGSSPCFANCLFPDLQSLDDSVKAPNSTCVVGDPLFSDPANLDFHLQKESPAVNAGAGNASMLSVTDLDGRPRVKHVRHRDNGDIYYVDIGCYERPYGAGGTVLMVK